LAAPGASWSVTAMNTSAATRARADGRRAKGPNWAKQRLRRFTARSWGVSMDERLQAIKRFVAGWTGYSYPADGERPFSDLDESLRRRLRQVRWKEWKRPKTRRRNLRALGVAEQKAREWAGSRKGAGASPAPHRSSAPSPMPTGLAKARSALPTTTAVSGHAERSAGCARARPVVWEAPG
jgi:hypothetical protein